MNLDRANPTPPQRFTRERYLAYKIVDALDAANLNPRTSPALQVWACVELEIKKWMKAEGIETDKPAS